MSLFLREESCKGGNGPKSLSIDSVSNAEENLSEKFEKKVSEKFLPSKLLLLMMSDGSSAVSLTCFTGLIGNFGMGSLGTRFDSLGEEAFVSRAGSRGRGLRYRD